MRSGQLQWGFGLLGKITKDYMVLEGTYIAPEGLSKRVVGMLKTIREVAVGVKDRMVNNVITLQDYAQYFKGCREKTSSSVSGLHFGHWKVPASSNKVAELQSILTYMAFKSETLLIWCCKVLKVILQNIYGNIKMEK